MRRIVTFASSLVGAWLVALPAHAQDGTAPLDTSGLLAAAIAGLTFGLIVTIDAYLSKQPGGTERHAQADHVSSEGHGIPGDEGEKGREQQGIPAASP